MQTTEKSSSLYYHWFLHHRVLRNTLVPHSLRATLHMLQPGTPRADLFPTGHAALRKDRRPNAPPGLGPRPGIVELVSRAPPQPVLRFLACAHWWIGILTTRAGESPALWETGAHIQGCMCSLEILRSTLLTNFKPGSHAVAHFELLCLCEAQPLGPALLRMCSGLTSCQ